MVAALGALATQARGEGLSPLSASAAGMGGAAAEQGRSALAALDDPALLSGPSRGEAALGLISQGGEDSTLHLGLMRPRADGGSTGLGLMTGRTGTMFHGSGSLKLFRSGWLGFGLKAGTLDPGDGLGRGWVLGPNLGFLFGVPYGGTASRLWASASLLDPFSRLNRRGIPSLALPNRRRIHLGWNITDSFYLVLGTDRLVNPETQTGMDAYRAGVAWSVLSDKLALRAGYETYGGQGLGITAGAGWNAGLWRADYAWSAGEGSADSRHRIEASWLVFPYAGREGPRYRAVSDRSPDPAGTTPLLRGVLVESRGGKAPKSENWISWKASFLDERGALVGEQSGEGPPPGQFLWDARRGRTAAPKDPGPLRLRVVIQRSSDEPLTVSAFVRPGPVVASRPSRVLDLSPRAREAAEFWRVEIRDKGGKLVKAFAGTGAPPAQLAWDGSDEKGGLVDEATELDYHVRTAGAKGTAFEETRALGRAGSGEIVDLKLAPPPEPTQEKRVSWSVQVMDEKGKTLKTLSGQGTPPVQIFMEKARSGGASPDSKVKISYTVRTPAKPGEKVVAKKFTWSEGKWLSQEVVEGLGDITGGSRAVRLTAAAFRAAGTIAFQNLLAGVLNFGPREEKLGRVALREIERIVGLWENRRESVVCVYGYSTAGGGTSGNQEEAQRFAGEVARVLEKIMGSTGRPLVRVFGANPAPLVTGGKRMEKKGTLVEVFLAPKPL